MKIHTVHPTTPSGLRRAYQPYRKKPHVARWYEGARQRNRFVVFIAPCVLAAFFPQTLVFYAYAEKTRGFWFIFESLDKMRFEHMSCYVILPVHTQMAAAISGFYFGGGLAK